MSTTTAAPTINVTAEEAGTIRIDPYYIAMMGGGGFDIEHFDPSTTRSMREHIEWLEGQQAHLEHWVAVLRQLDDGVLVAEPWIIETVRENAVGLHGDSLAHNDRCGGSCNCADIEQRSMELHALADRLEAELATPPVPVTPDEAEALRRVIALQFAPDTPTALACPRTFEIHLAAMNEWAPIYDALDNGVLPVEQFVVDTFRTEYTVGADIGGVDERAIAVLGSVVERLDAVCIREEAAA
jgi:hypothetical protein